MIGLSHGQPGNHGAIFGRQLDVNRMVGLRRGVTDLWNLCGVPYAPPIR